MNGNAFLAALGQLFYSMSLAMGIMITYGSYLKKDEDIESSVRNIEIFDTGIAFLAGLMIVPAVFVFSGGDEAALKTGPTLMFITLPKVFDSMAGGTVMGAVFFILVLFAALTSAISLMETVVSIFVDWTKKSRSFITVCVTVYTILMAIPSSLGFGVWSGFNINGLSILDFFRLYFQQRVDADRCSFDMHLYRICGEAQSHYGRGRKLGHSDSRSKTLYIILIKYISPVLLVLILVSSVLNTLGINTL